MLEPGPATTRSPGTPTSRRSARSRRVFCSGQGAVSITDMPGRPQRVLRLADQHGRPAARARSAGIVSKAFTPRMLEQLVGSVQQIVEDVARRRPPEGRGRATARIDVVADIAAPIPLRVICDMMGVPEEDRALVLRAVEHRPVRRRPGADREPGRPADRRSSRPAWRWPALMERLAAERLERPDATTSPRALVTTEVDGERLTHQEIASFFILLLRRRQRDDPQRDHPGHPRAVGAPRAAGPLDGRPVADPHRGRGDRALGQPGHLDAPHGDPGRRAERPSGSAPATSSCSSTPRPTATRRSSADPHVFDLAPRSRTRTSASARTARTSASAPTWPAGRSR